MFDVRPVNNSGDLDVEKISQVGQVLMKPVVTVPRRDPLFRPVQPAPVMHFSASNDDGNSAAEKSERIQVRINPEERLRNWRMKREQEEKERQAQRAELLEQQRLLEIERQERLRWEKMSQEDQSKELLLQALEREKQERLEQEALRMREEETRRQQEFAERKREEERLQKAEQKQLLQLKQEQERLRQAKEAAAKEKKQRLQRAVRSPFRALVVSTKTFLKAVRRKEKHSQESVVPKRRVMPFFVTAAAVFVLIFGVGFSYRSLKVKSLALENGQVAYASLNQAKDAMKYRDFDQASVRFDDAYQRFSQIKSDVDGLGRILVDASRFVPYLSKLSSGEHLAQAGKDISRIGELAADTLKSLDAVKNPLGDGGSISFLKVFQDTDKNITEISASLDDLESNLDGINLEDIPESQQSQFVGLKKGLPELNKFMANLSQEEKVLTDVLGGNGQRKYLFLFQNNQEMRPTGGFIGSYGVLDIADGNVKNFFVDGIFNPDGQLREKVVPPAPIQKISAAWSLHDSNWFPDFPVSAEKACWFYEKTGGPTVDGVITMTPTVMQRLLEITGPIDMPDYGVTIDKDNFLESIQNEVEVDYDKEENQPKKILADLAPKILDRLFNARDISEITRTMDVLLESLNEKHILIYSKNYDIEKMVSRNGWSGEVLDADKDYLSVINTNINGYKTDGVIDEKIEHQAQIQSDGSVIDTVTITRKHNGGNTPYEWWNKVNADYMRVYVPKGSKLVQVSGQTNEFDSPPLDYKALNFKQDPQVTMEEEGMTIDPQSGTRIYEDAGKTVFANWVYVSPQESVTIRYSYLLPFKLDMNLTSKPADTYSLLAQKQSGSLGSTFSSQIVYPDTYDPIWKYPNDDITSVSSGEEHKQALELDTDLKTDRFIGIAFEKHNP